MFHFHWETAISIESITFIFSLCLSTPGQRVWLNFATRGRFNEPLQRIRAVKFSSKRYLWNKIKRKINFYEARELSREALAPKQSMSDKQERLKCLLRTLSVFVLTDFLLCSPKSHNLHLLLTHNLPQTHRNRWWTQCNRRFLFRFSHPHLRVKSVLFSWFARPWKLRDRQHFASSWASSDVTKLVSNGTDFRLTSHSSSW